MQLKKNYSRTCGMPRYKLKLVRVKKFPTRFPFNIFGNFSEQVEDLSWHAAVRPFSF